MNKSEPILRPCLYKIAHNARSSRRASWTPSPRVHARCRDRSAAPARPRPAGPRPRARWRGRDALTPPVEVTHCHGLTRHASALYRRGYTTDEGEAWLHEIKHDPSGLSPEMEERPTLRPAGVLLFARFRWWEQPESLRGTIEHALFLPSGRPNLWGTPDNPRLPGVRAVWLNTIRDVTFQAIGSDSAILSYRDRSKHRSRRDNS